MIRTFALVFSLVLSVLVAACGTSTVQDTTDGTTVDVVTFNEDVERIDKIFTNIKVGRGVSEGWATEVRPGDTRRINQIVIDLMKMEILQKDLDELDPSDQVAGLQSDIRQVMIDDLRLVLRIATRDEELGALGQFLRIAPKLDTSLEEDFGTNPTELRAEALKIARKDVAEMRPRLHDGDSEAIGYVASVLQEWQFAPQEIGLTAQDMKSIGQ